MSRFYFLTAFFFVGSIVAGSALAQSNMLYILQDNAGAMGPVQGNTLFVDQTDASDSLIGGSLTDDSVPARQIGQGNSADVRISGTGGTLALNQIEQASQFAGNRGDIDLDGFNPLATLLQEGANNSGTLSVSGTNAFGALEQIGNNNTGFVDVQGIGTSGRLVQNGNNNDTGIQVGGDGTTVTVIQNGNNLSSAPQVISNGATVNITQTR